MNAYGYDSRRRARARQTRRRMTGWRLFRVTVILTQVALVIGVIAYDHIAHPGALTPPVHGHPLEVTQTLPPHPATSPSHP